jgi:hypothetical protein
MSTSEEIINLSIKNPDYGYFNVDSDKFTADDKLKFKLRDIELIKYNPTLFTNRGSFLEMIGGYKTILTSFSLGALFYLYRRQANVLRGYKIREGVWNSGAYAFVGALIGLTYSSLFFVRWNVLLNDYYAAYIIKRYAGSDKLNNTNIYKLRGTTCDEECYYFTSSYYRSYHI